MKQAQILLVETAGGTLASLPATLAARRPDWQLLRVTDTGAALELLAQRSIGVVVGSFGADRGGCARFFRAVQERQPRAIRVCLQLAGSIHEAAPADCVQQSIAVSSGAEEIEQAIARSLSVWRRAQANAGLGALLPKLDRIPTPPALYFTVRDEIESPTGTLARVAALIGRDPALSARVLKVANSGFYSMPCTVADLQYAIALIGTDMVLGLVLSAHLFDRLPVPGLKLDTLWQHGFTVSELAKHIAQERGAERTVVTAAGVAALLHDIGSLVLLANYPGEYQSVIRLADGDEAQLLALESERFGVSHPELGAVILELWCLPETVVRAVARHHQSPQADCRASEAVYLAEMLVNDYARSGGAHRETGDGDYPLAVSPAQLGQWWNTCGQLVRQVRA